MYFKIGKLKNPEYLAWIRKQPCVRCLSTPTVAHHILTGTAKRNIDLATLPMCVEHHNDWHSHRFISVIDQVTLSYKYISEYINDKKASS